MRTFIGHWLTSEGRRHNFEIEARDHDHAEDLAADLSPRATIDGELVCSEAGPDDIEEVIASAVFAARSNKSALEAVVDVSARCVAGAIAVAARGDPEAVEKALIRAEWVMSCEAARVAPVVRKMGRAA